MKLYFIRHGQSEGNAAHFHNSWLQVNLTEQGKEDARMAGRLLKGLSFDKVYTSDLVRTIQTKEIALPGVEAEALKMLREVNIGSLLGRKVADCTAEYGEPYLRSRRVKDYSLYGGESYEMLCDRVREFLTMMEASDYERVAVFCHRIYIEALADVVTGARHDSTMLCSNGSVSVFEFRDGKWYLEVWNCKEL